MNNFFFDNSDMSLFKKAMRATKNETVVINILSSDPSLKKNIEKKKGGEVRKTFSDKFEPSPFGKFFGPRRARTTPVDMRDFSSWKNKNYRNAEKSINETEEVEEKFSISEFLANSTSDEKYHELDQAKSELQKPINQLSSSDPQYKKYALDSFLTKLEEQTNVKSNFEENDDILEPLGDLTEKVVPDSTQDENFGFSSAVDVQKVASEDISGEKFRFETSELDKIRNRLDKIEKENLNIKDKPTEKVLSTEISDLTKGDEDELDLDKLGVDDIDSVNEKLKVNDVTEIEKNENAPKVKGKKFFEINRNDVPQDEADEANIDEDSDEEILKSVGVLEQEEAEKDDTETEETNMDDAEENQETDEELDDMDGESIDLNLLGDDDYDDDIIDEDESLDIDDLPQDNSQTDSYVEPVEPVEPQAQIYDMGAYAQKQNELQEKIIELIEQNKKDDSETEEKLKLAEEEKARMTQEYEQRLKQLEETYKKDYEEFRRKAYLEKLDNDIKLQKAQKEFKEREQKIKENEKAISKTEKAGAILRKELKSNLSISNLEMEKKLLEKSGVDVDDDDELIENDVDEVVETVEEKPKTQRKTRTTRKTTTRKTTKSTTKSSTTKSTTKKKTQSSTAKKKPAVPKRKPVSRPKTTARKRKIDSDIIGGIKFD